VTGLLEAAGLRDVRTEVLAQAREWLAGLSPEDFTNPQVAVLA
jgi:hypothetical protein